ncbi:MAG: hypothetical protein Q8L97_12045 [Nitrosomonas sp.]|uniref:hypothetical protein n=1 Tax=Nitrosomonas sp. TaxID=42353 RepID=UPI002730BBBC|nr:hypothetical protein [Nitrosomonas sp.]MDP1550864.1 hypothetical protein [Nitrosomonas sp.]
MAADPNNTTRKKALLILGWMVFPGLLAGAAAWVMSNWHIPTRIQANLTVTRVAFTPGGMDAVPILERAANFRSLTFERFSQVALSPKKVEVMGAASSMRANDRANLANSLQKSGEIILLGEMNHRPVITIESVNEKAESAGRLESIAAMPDTDVIFDANHGSSHTFTIKLEKSSASPTLLLINPFKLTAFNVSSKELDAAQLKINPIVLQIDLREDNPLVKVGSESGELIVTFTPVKNVVVNFLEDSGVPISQISFSKQNKSGKAESALVSVGEVTYMDFPDIKKSIDLAEHESFSLENLNNAKIKQLRYDSEKAGFVVRLEGEAGVILTGSGSFTKDHRLTLFDRLWHDSRLIVIFSIMAWVCSATVAAYKMYREEKNRA